MEYGDCFGITLTYIDLLADTFLSKQIFTLPRKDGDLDISTLS
jgi:hypothetical protein